MTAQDLKNSILQLAVQGKLVPQDPNDEPASELLKRIRAEKTLAPIAEEEIPFVIPGSWEWVRLGDVATNQNGLAFKPTDWIECGTPIIRIQNLTDLKSQANFCNAQGIDKKFFIHSGDVLVSWSCTIDAFLYQGGEAVLNQHIFKIIFDRIQVNKDYYIYAIKSLLSVINSKRHGVTMTHITKTDFEKILFPLPPLAEQERIVAKIEELLPLIEEYDKAEKQLSALNTEFPDKLRKSILQQAVMGKLTERDPADEPASELLKRICAEKEKLIKEGKIKKEKPLPPISEEEIPFEIPDTWEWVRLSNLSIAQITYGIIKLGEEDKNGVKVLRCSDVKPGWIDHTGIRTVKKSLSDEYERTILRGGEIVINVRGTLGGCAIVPKEFAGYNVAREVAVISLSDYVNSSYLMYLLLSPTFDNYLSDNLRGVAYKGLNIELLSSFVIPLPPLAEQKRIVARVEELLKICERLR